MIDELADLESRAMNYLDEHRAELMAEYFDLVSIPSVSADPEHTADVARCAELIAARLQRMGLDDVRVDPTDGHPVVSARTPLISGASTYLVYAHYDVQPADPLDEWETPPFIPTLLADELRGRGISDDKAHVHLHLAAIEALITASKLGVNIRVIFEGEEEISSRHFETWLGTQPDLRSLAGCIVSDTTFLTSDVPSLGTGVRGLLYAQIDVETAAHDLHSGGYGGAAPNAAEALAFILAQLKHADGHVAIPDFYADVIDDRAFRDLIPSLPFDEAECLRGAAPCQGQATGETGFSLLERLWLRPTLDINGMWSGHTGEGPKTVIPARAHARVSCRLVADQHPERVFAGLSRLVAESTPQWAKVTVTLVSASFPARADATGPLAEAALGALAHGFGREPVLQREGGSIPVVGMLTTRFPGTPLILLGFSPPDDAAHAPNERMRMWNLDGGLRTLIRMWLALGLKEKNR
jgi:acetylornithine deacetylase/succinyl-diaminopimelate desuccinylase-like protein